MLTGGLIGLAVWALPLATFSGEQQLQPLLLGRWEQPPALLVLGGVLKLLLAGLCLETGWRGGLIFPVLAGSTAIGMGLDQLLPALGDAGIWCGSVVGGSLGALLPSPLLALVHRYPISPDDAGARRPEREAAGSAWPSPPHPPAGHRSSPAPHTDQLSGSGWGAPNQRSSRCLIAT